jgi:uncharacterized membrane protein (DUF373 family)
VKIEETTPRLPAWAIHAVESGILDWSDVREIFVVVAREERSAFSWWRTIAISLVLALLCWIASRF